MKDSSLRKASIESNLSSHRKKDLSRSRNNSNDLKQKEKQKIKKNKQKNLKSNIRSTNKANLKKSNKITPSSVFTLDDNNLLCNYAYNSFEGTVRDYNEDIISIQANIPCPKDKDQSTWPVVHFFAIYDGHGGSKCTQFLHQHLKKYIIESNDFPQNPQIALLNAFAKVEEAFISDIKPCNLIDNHDKSGSCALVLIIIDNICYCASLGDSLGFYFQSYNKTIYQINQEHKPNQPSEKRRIESGGGTIYQKYPQSQSCAWRIQPGKLSISRSFGDFYAKSIEFGGNPDVLIAIPEITSFKLTDRIDFIVLGCDGIYDTLNQKDILKIAGKYLQTKKNILRESYSTISSEICDLIMKRSMTKGSLDNISCIIITLRNFFNPTAFTHLNHWNKDALPLLSNDNLPNHKLYSIKSSKKASVPIIRQNLAKMTADQNYQKRFSSHSTIKKND